MPDVAAAARAIDRDLPEMARSVIRRHLDLNAPENRRFLAHPDGREEHQVDWHQWGIITHTRVFLRDFETAVPRYLRAWGLWDPVQRLLEERIDGARKADLLRIAILLHDIGKFAARQTGRTRFHFAHHEELSAQIICRELDLPRFGLTPAQIRYVAMTAGDHFVLGLVRKQAREQGEYDAAFVESRDFGLTAERIRHDHPSDFVEIGLLFLGDSLAKAHPPDGPERALSQYHVNIAVAHRYLEIVLSDRSL